MIGSIANNRFLQRVNPEITRAVADSGSSLNHSEIQQLARNMVDLGLWGNLKLWVHSGLVKTRTAGADTFVSKAYDISSNDNDAAQATEANQPKLVSLGIDFTVASSHTLASTTAIGDAVNDAKTFCCYVNLKTALSGTDVYGDPIFRLNYNTNAYLFSHWRESSTSRLIVTRDRVGISSEQVNFNSPSTSTWYFLLVTLSGTTLTFYVNGSSHASRTVATSTGSIDIGVGHAMFATAGSCITNDCRVFNKALSTTEITSIYNQSKTYYGL